MVKLILSADDAEKVYSRAPEIKKGTKSRRKVEGVMVTIERRRDGKFVFNVPAMNKENYN